MAEQRPMLAEVSPERRLGRPERSGSRQRKSPRRAGISKPDLAALFGGLVDRVHYPHHLQLICRRLISRLVLQHRDEMRELSAIRLEEHALSRCGSGGGDVRWASVELFHNSQ